MHKAIIMVMLAAATSWGAVEFDGVDQYCRVAASASITDQTVGTVALWAHITTAAANETLLSVTDESAFFGLSLQIHSSGELRAYFYVGGSLSWVRATTAALDDDSIYHIAVRHNGSAPTLYLDGVAVSQYYVNSTDATAWFSDCSGLDYVNVGRRVLGGSGGNYFDGMIDDARIYSTALTSNQIASIVIDTCDKFVPEYGTNTTLIANQDPGFDARESNTNLVAMWDSDYLPVADGNAIYTAIFLGVNQTYWGSSYDQRKLIEFDSNFAVTGNEFDLNAEYHSKIAMWFNSAPREVCFYGDYVFIAEKGYAECIVVLNASDFSFYCYRNIREFADITGSVLEGIAVDENYIYITSTTRKIYRFTISGTTINYIDYFDVSAQVPALATLSIGIGNDGNLYTMNNGDDNVYYYDVSGNFLGTYDPTFFSANANPYSIQQMSNGNWVISDLFASGNNKISVFNSTFGSPTYYDAPATSSANVLSGFDNLNPITGTWHDATGNGNDATIYNNPTREAPR